MVGRPNVFFVVYSILGAQKEVLRASMEHIPSSHCLFSHLLVFVGLDHSVLLDFLISSETHFLNYFTWYLKVVTRDWVGFRSAHSEPDTKKTNGKVYTDSASSSRGHVTSRIDSVMSVLIRLRLAVERLHHQGLFPYNPAPLLTLLEQTEERYENDGTEFVDINT